MLINAEKNILIVGLGLIGGSYAMGLTKTGFNVNAIDINGKSIKYAKEQGIINEGADYNDPVLIGQADILVFALYPHVFVEWIRENQQYIKNGAVLTDVTGVKTCVVYEIQDMLREDLEYIPAHPMAGKESSGVENSDEKIFYDSNYLIVPTENNTQRGIDICREIGLILHFGRISVLTPEEHDSMIGFVSQLTHCIAVSLMTCSDNEHLVDYTGDSFRDLTRIAKINENMWTELFLANKECLLNDMDKFIAEITNFRDMLKNEDTEGMKQKMRLSTTRRKLFDK